MGSKAGAVASKRGGVKKRWRKKEVASKRGGVKKGAVASKKGGVEKRCALREFVTPSAFINVHE